jgi:hypothetical protein
MTGQLWRFFSRAFFFSNDLSAIKLVAQFRDGGAAGGYCY